MENLSLDLTRRKAHLSDVIPLIPPSFPIRLYHITLFLFFNNFSPIINNINSIAGIFIFIAFNYINVVFNSFYMKY